MHLELVAEEIRPARLEHVVAADRFPGPMDGNCVLLMEKLFAGSPIRHGRQLMSKLLPGPLHATVKTQRQIQERGCCRCHQARSDPVVNETLSLQGVSPGDPSPLEYGSPQRFRLVLDVPGVRLRDYRARN